MFPGAGRAHAYVVAASCLISVFHFVLSGTAFFFSWNTLLMLFFFCLLCLTALPRSFAAAVTSLRLLFFSFSFFFSHPFLSRSYTSFWLTESSKRVLIIVAIKRYEGRTGGAFPICKCVHLLSKLLAALYIFFFGMHSLLFTICCRKARQRLRRKKTWKGDRFFSPIFA